MMPRILAALLFALLYSAAVRAAESEAELFGGATAAFTNKFYARAEQQFADFVQKHPASTNRGAAVLYQAQARFFQRKHDAAIDLLKAEVERAGPLADQYQFWQAEVLFDKGDFDAAGGAYKRVLTDFPKSPLALRASYLQANSAFQQTNFTHTVELLRNPEGTFQRLSKDNPRDEFAVKGNLLLAEALLALSKFAEAQAVLSTIPALAEKPDLEWERHQLAARVEFAGPKPELALPHLTNAVTVATNQPRFQAQTWNLEAEVHKKLSRPDAAVTAYDRIINLPSLPSEQRRLAMLKSVELLSRAGRLTNAIARLETYIQSNTNEPAVDLLRLKAGELWIEQFRSAPAVTNALAQARVHLRTIVDQFTNSVHLGKAWLNLGWSFWEEGAQTKNTERIRESETAFSNAVTKLTRSDEQALAVFKLGDARLQLGQARAAATNYLSVLRNFADLPQARSSLFDLAYRQLVRALIESGDLGEAEKMLAEYRAGFANTVAFEETLSLFGRALAREGRTAEARKVFDDFIKHYPGSALLPQVRFSEARTYAAEQNWKTAIEKQEQWLATYTNHQLRAEVEFQRALLHDQSGSRTNALRFFTNFIAQFPTHPLAPAAQNWVADYYYDREDWLAAEQQYQRLFQNTNWMNSRFHFPARMMAARSAFFREGYSDARSYLTNIIQDPRCPANLQPEAWFALGDVYIEQPIVGNTNAVANFVEAAKVFNHIATQLPTNALTPLALARKGDCHANLVEFYPDSFKEALESYRAVLAMKTPAVPVAARNQAEVGLALLLKHSAEKKNPAEREALLRQSLDHLLNVVYGSNNGEPPDPFYLKKAGLEAGRIAESLGDHAAALELYRRLREQAPSLRTFWDGRIATLQQRLAATN